jgi:hypothetical protein
MTCKNAQTNNANPETRMIINSDGNVKIHSLTSNRALITNINNELSVSQTTSTELGYLSGTTASVQTQLNTKGNLAGENIWTGLQKFNDNIGQTVAVFGADKSLISSTVSSITLSYLDVTSSVQNQLNTKSNLIGGNTFSGNQVFNSGSLSISSRFFGEPDSSPIGNFWIGLRGSGTEADRLAISINGNQSTGVVDRVIIAKALRLSQPTVNRVLTIDTNGDVVSSIVTPTTLTYLDIGSSLTSLLNDKISRSGGEISGNITGTGLNYLRWHRSGEVRNNLAPNIVPGNTMAWYFGTYNNNDNTPFADQVVLNGWTDTSGGLINMISYNKADKGIRQYQQTYGSSTRFGTWYDCVMTDANSANVSITGQLTVNNNIKVSNNNAIEFGVGLIKEVNAGRIGYNWVAGAGLEIVGGGTTPGQRAVVLYDKCGVGISPTAQLTVNGSITIKSLNGVYEAGCIYSDVNWGMLFRGAVVPNLAHFRWDSSAGAELMRINTNGNLGIATNDPTSKLHLYEYLGTTITLQTSGVDYNYIRGTTEYFSFNANYTPTGTRPNVGRGSSQIALWQPTAGGFITFNTSPAVNTDLKERIRITSGGLVGFGVSNPTTLIDTSLSSTDTSSNYVRVRVTAGTHSGISLTETGWWGHSIRYNQNTDSLVFSIQDDTPTFTDRMTLTYSGNLGIGTSIPQTALHIARDFTTNGDYKGMISFENTQAGGYLDWQMGPQVIGGGALFSIRGGADGLGSISNMFNILPISTTVGRIGINTTTIDSTLHLYENLGTTITLQTSSVDFSYIRASPELTMISTNLSLSSIPNTGRGSCQIVLQTPQAGGFIQFMTGSAVNTVPLERMRITANGYVGVGIPSSGYYVDPLTKFTINSTYGVGGENSGLCINATDGNVYNLRLYPYIQASSQVAYQFQVSNRGSVVNAMAIGHNGFIGIGTINPNHLVNWVGNVDGGVEQYGQNLSSGGSAYTLFGVRNNTPSQLIMFINSTTRTGDGGASTGTIRNDAGALRLQSSGSNGIFIASTSGNVGIGTGTFTPTGVVDVYNTTADYTNSVVIRTPWSSITLDNTQIAGGNKWSILAGGTGAGVGTGNFGIFDITGSAYRFGLLKTGQIQLGTYLPRARVGVMGGNATGNVSTTTAWPDDANGILISDAAASQTSSTSALFLGHQQNLSTINSLAPSVAWKDLYVLSKDELHYTNGSFNVYLLSGTSGWLTVSDVREKEDIQLLKTDKSLQRVMALKPYHYRRKYYDSATPVEEEIKQKRQIGFLAQDVKESNPHCVNTWCNKEAIKKRDEAKVEIDVEEEEVKVEINIEEEEDDGERFSLNYNDYVIHLVGAVQEQQRMVNEQSKQLEVERREIELLTQRNQKIETEFSEYRDQTDRRMTQLTELVKGLLEEKK